MNIKFTKRVLLLGVMTVPALCFAQLTCSNYDTPLWFTPSYETTENLLNALDYAHHEIQLATYTLTYKKVLNRLAKAKNRGVIVSVVVDRRPYRAKKANLKAIKWLKKHGIIVKQASQPFQHFHQKTLIIDKHKAYLMTGNFTYSSFNKQRNVVVLITQSPLVRQIEQTYQADWHNVVVDIKPSSLVWSPDNTAGTIFQLMNHAKQHIRIYAPQIGGKEFIASLIKVAKKGIEITLITRKTHQTFDKKIIASLRKNKIHVICMKHPTLHAKMILIDKRMAYIGSSNFTHASLHFNRELGIISCNTHVIHRLIKQFNQDEQNSAPTLIALASEQRFR